MVFETKREVIDADLVAIGAGQAAVPPVRALAGAGQRTVLIKRDHLGAAIVGENASELIHTLSITMHLDAPLSAIDSSIFTHPTLGEGLQSAVSGLPESVA